MDDRTSTQRAFVGGLASAFRVEGRLIQQDNGPSVLPINSMNTGRELKNASVFVVELLSHAAIMHIYRRTRKQSFGIITG